MLAVIGKVLLVIVLILLVLLGALLLVPLRYRLQVRKYPGRSLEGSFGVSWLLRFVSLCGTLSGDRVLDMSLKICGFTLKKIRKGGNIPESKETDSPEPEKQKENDSGRADDTPPAGGQMYGDDADRYGVEEPVPSAAGMTEHPGIRAEDPHSEADESPYEDLPESIRDKASEASEASYKGPPRRIRRLRNRKNQKKESAGEAHREKGGLFRKIPELLQTVCEKICDLVLAAADGADRAEEALSQAANLLGEHLKLFIDLSEEAGLAEVLVEKDEKGKEKILEMTIEDLDLSVRSFNCLKRAGINTVDDLINKSEEEMMKVRNLGKKSFDEVKEKLQSLGFDLSSEAE